MADGAGEKGDEGDQDTYGAHRRELRSPRVAIGYRRSEAIESVGSNRGPELAPRALRCVLVVTEADELRPVPKAVRLHLVVAHFDDDLGAHGSLLELAATPAVGLGEPPLGGVLEERQDASRNLVVARRGHGSRADVVDLAVLAVEPEQQGGDPVGPRLPADADDDAVRLFSGFTFTTPSRDPGRYASPRRFAITPSRPIASKRSSQPSASSRSCVAGESSKRFALRSSAARRLERLMPHLDAVPHQDVERDEPCGDLGREPADAALGGVKAHLHRIEVEDAVPLDDDLAVERRPRRQSSPSGRSSGK